MTGDRCVILCAGAITAADAAWAAIGPEDFVVAADAGYLRARDLGIRPSLIVGDFDSAADPGDTGVEVERFSSHKDDTDCMLAVRRGLARGCRRFVILGGLGGRLDHTLANLQTLGFLADRGCRGELRGDGAWATLVRGGSLTLPDTGGYLSVFAFGGPCSGVSETGVEYPLRDARLTSGFPLGVSNRFTAPQAAIGVKQGTLLVVTTAKD